MLTGHGCHSATLGLRTCIVVHLSRSQPLTESNKGKQSERRQLQVTTLLSRRMAGWFPLLLCVFFSTGLSTRQLALAGAASSSKVVTRLPGFPGRLPFHLETGYVEVDEVNGAEMFYYFVESEAGGEDAPFLLWLTGGDRCSVLSGLALEIGPFRFVIEPYSGTVPRLKINPYSWTKVANILFVDSPVGAGFSFSRQQDGYDVGDVSTSLQLHEFLIKWFTDHPKFLVNPLYIGGDSYAGKIVPFIAQKVSEGVEARRRPPLNLKTIMGHCLGQDYTMPTNALCTQTLVTFRNLLYEVMLAQILSDNCGMASVEPGTEMGDSAGGGRKILSHGAVTERERRVINLPDPPTLGCVTYGAYLSYFWANDELTRDALGIKEGTVDEWMRCHTGDVPYTRDIKSSIRYHWNVTANGYRALVYSGDHDGIVPHLGTQSWVRSLGFPIVDDWRAWHLHGQSAGFTITYSNNMTFATIKGAGHTAPEYEPERCFAMFTRWILNLPL
uniref:Uncharacterized protein n=1 Tax=Avena sativa TaxID=4498 RepID=A0ACD5US93_AVESA